MKKGLNILFIFMLVFQSMFTSMAFSNTVAAEGSKKEVDTDVTFIDEDENKVDPDKHEGKLFVQVDWSIDNDSLEAGDKADIHLSISEKIELMSDQSGKLEFEDKEIATYDADTEGNILVEFTEEVEEIDADKLEGTFTLEGEVEAEEEENEEDESKEEESEEKEKDQEAPEEETTQETDAEDKKDSNEEKKESLDENNKEESSDEAPSDKEVADKEKAAKEEKKETDEKKESKDEKKEASDKKSSSKSTKAARDGEKHGFKLEIDEILDLDDEPFDEQHPMDPHEEFKLKLDWYLEDGHNYVAGDKETFDLPKGIKVLDEINIELKDDFGQIVANAVITTDKKVELTFTDFVEGHSAVSGWMEIISELDIAEVEEEDGEVIIDPIGEEDELRIPIEELNKDKTIEKQGEPNKGYNADEINWAVTINKNKTSLENAKVIDELPEGTEFKEDSLKVTKLKVDLYGNILGDGEEVEITPEFGKNGELIIPLGDTNDAYRVEYVTTVTDDDKQHFENNATLKDDELDDVSVKSTITINRGEPIKKSAVKNYDPKTGIIEWQIEFNYNQKDLSDVTLNDAWTPKGMLELVEDSLKFQEVSIDENGHAHHEGDAINLPEGASLTVVDDGFKVDGITTEKAYEVTYQTKVKDRVLDPEDVSNTAGFGSESDNSGTHIGQFYGAKSAGTIDYAEKTIEWTIRINHDEYPMENISIEDTLGDGLTLLEDTVNVTVGGESYTDYDLIGDNPFTIDFPEDYTTDKEIIITYKTAFDADNVPDNKPTNKAAITWTPEGENDSITKEVEAETELNKETADYSWKNGSYNPETKEITWEIITNYRENDFDDLVVQDNPQGNQQIIDGSAVVKELVIDSGGGISEGDTVEGAATIDEEANTLTVNLGETNKAYKITYKTSLEGLDDMQDEYVNEAEVLDGDEIISEIDSKVGIVKDSKYGDKSGYQDGKQVHWSIDVNFVQQKVNDLKLVDSISENQEFLEDSIKVYHANIDGNGNASKGEEVSSNEYTLDIDQEAGEFTVKWNDEVERGFIVEYSTLFFEKHNGEVSNEYTITGDSIGEEESDASGSDDVTITQLGSGGGEGTAGYLVIDKVDSTHGQEETSLAGAEFDLIDADTGNVLKSGTTDENGQIDFGRLLFGNYILKETKVPEGYVTPEEEQIRTIDIEYKPGDDKQGFAYTVENYKPVFAVELSKTDDEGNALADAEFTLFDSEDSEIATETTNEDGKILFEDLKEAGTYYVQETKAPAGYVLDEKKHEVTVGDKEKEPVTVTAENKERGAAQLTKIDQDTNEVLEGVEFDLQKKSDAGEYETVDTFTTDENGQIQTSNTLEAGDYQFVEVKGLDGYRTNEEEITFTIDVNDTNTQTFTMENEKFKGSIKLIKRDAATEDLLAGAEFTLVDADGEVVKENLVTNEDGEIVIDDLFLGKYQLIETKAPEGYELDETPIDVEVTEDEQVVEVEATNNQITDISVEKKWNNAGGDTESVTVKLLPTDQTAELDEENDWQATFKDLHVYDESGEEIDYEVEELKVDGYNSEVTGDKEEGFVVTNTTTTSVLGTKTWLDDLDEHPAITVELLANGTKVADAEVNEDTDWKYAFTDLDKYDESGEEITYTIEEVEVDGYETTIDGFDITNLRVGETEVTGTKTWLDDDSENRPDSITVYLLANGEQVDEMDVTAESDWEYAFTELPEFDEEGKEIVYTVDEESIEGYEKSIDGNDITNLRVGTTEVEITKSWKDENETDRPETIKVNLLQNGEFYEEYEVTKENDWKLTITDLPKYDDEGVAYEYTVKEHDVPGYASEVDGFEITNTRTDVKSIEITKTWLDDNSDDRPDSIEVELFRSVAGSEKEQVDTITLTQEDDWSLEVADLPAFDADGKAYMYEIEEKAVEGYETSINGFELTNVRVGKTDVTGEKKWNEVDESYRPDSVTIQLLANGEEIDSTEVTKDTDWTYGFTDLDKYDDQGKEITYTVEESDIPKGYESEVDGFVITNTQKSTKVAGEKTWNEVDDRYRPDAIEVQLLANDEKVDAVYLSKETDWKYEFTDLAKYDQNGKEIKYTVEEINVPKGYESEVDGFDITNTQKETSVKGEKSWDEVDKQYRPDQVIIQLLANGEEASTVEVSSETDWEYAFTNLAKYDKDGKKIDYTVKELDVPKGYKSTVDGYDITNKQETTEVTGTKTWLDDDSKDRPETITVQVKNGKDVVEEKEISSEDREFTFDNLPKYNKKGEEIEYTVDEVKVEGYEKSIDGNDITNLRVGETKVSGEKVWDEADDQYRPEYVKVQLLANDKEVGDPIKVSSKDDWVYNFNDLDKYDEKGTAITYNVKELDVPKGYKSTVDGYDITNKQETTEVTGTKTWLDGDGEDRPGSITVELFANGDSIDTTKVTSKSDWKYEFTELPKYDKEGEKIKYTIDEKSVEGYDKSIDGTDITNTKLTDVIGTKTWKNDDSKDRPESITVKLLQNGNEINSTKVTAKDDWKYAFTDLPAYDENNKAYKYTIEEVAVDGYESKVDGYDITNTWIDEDEEVPTDPTDPSEPTKPTKPSGPTEETSKLDKPGEADEADEQVQSLTGKSDESDDDKGSLLPSTATNMFNILLAGALLLVIGAGFIIFRRNKNA